MLPGLTTPLVKMWREALQRHTIHVADSTDYLRQPAAFLGDVFAFLGVRTLKPEEMRAIVALPTELVTSALDERTTRRGKQHVPLQTPQPSSLRGIKATPTARLAGNDVLRG